MQPERQGQGMDAPGVQPGGHLSPFPNHPTPTCGKSILLTFPLKSFVIAAGGLTASLAACTPVIQFLTALVGLVAALVMLSRAVRAKKREDGTP